jgi:hypothetical protein
MKNPKILAEPSACLTLDGLFPLTPTLSLRERECCHPIVGESRALELKQDRDAMPPLAEGEGWGEGEQNALSRSRAALAITSRFFLLFLSFCALSLLADAPTTFKVSEFTFTRPASWEWVETTSSMRKAQLKVPDPKSKASADVIFFHFGKGDGGGTKANVERWLGQFKEPRDQINSKTEEVTVGKHKVTYVQAQGTYMSGMPGGPQSAMPDYALAGAIIEAVQGNVFIRMSGPKDLVKASLPDFKKMVEGALK